ncbi:MAG: SDR family oxidoreductase [Firmicutes bacterium]|nr:SDR family oxidoreductase [Bacillota bacterium]
MQPDFSLTGSTALVTGAGKGIGRVIALALASSGADVVLTARTQAELEDVAGKIRADGRRAWTVTADISDAKQAKGMAEQALGAAGRIDILVNNAGVSFPQPAEDVTEECWDRTFNVNMKGLFFVTQVIGRAMIAQGGGGRIINVASQAGLVGLPDHAAYCASKGGVVLLTKVLAIEWARYKINVNAVAPTVIVTPMTDVVFADPEKRQAVMQKIPLGKFGLPEDVAGAVIFLASPAASMITGATLLIDGGWVAQ